MNTFKKSHISAAVVATLGLSGIAHGAAVTGIVVRDVDGDGFSGRFGFNILQLSRWTGDVGTGTILGQGAANPTGSFSSGFNFAGQPFVPYTFGGGMVADITGGALTVSNMDFGGNFAGQLNFNLPPDGGTPAVNFVNATANPNQFDVKFNWSHYITETDDPSGYYVGFTTYWTVEGTATIVPDPAADIDIEPDGTEQQCTESGGTTVQLTASLTVGNIASVTWMIDGVFAGDTETITPFLELGQHSVQVDVVADNGATDSATETITVADTTPPVIDAAFIDGKTGQEITQASPADRVQPSVAVTDLCDPEPVINAVVGIPTEDGDTFFANKTPKRTLLRSNTSPGHIELSVSASDASGNTATENTQLELVK